MIELKTYYTQQNLLKANDNQKNIKNTLMSSKSGEHTMHEVSKWNIKDVEYVI